MAKGYPDYFGYSMFPTYGKMLRDNLPITPFATGTTLEVFSIASKAILQGGYIGIDGSSNSPFIKIRASIDGEVSLYIGLNIMYAYGLTLDSPTLVYLLNYSPAYESYAIGIKSLIPIEYEFKVEIVNTSGDALTARGDLNYSNIQT